MDDQDRTVAIIGSGGIGGFLAGALSEAGRDPLLCVRTPFEQLVIETGGETRTHPVRQASDPSDAEPVRWILLTTKAQDTAGARPWIEALARPGTTLVMVQNGLGHAERAAPVAEPAGVMPAIIYCSVERSRPGHVVHHNAARLIVPRGPDGARLAALFEGTVFEVVQDEDFTTAAWRKLLGNLVANPVTALTLRRMPLFREPAAAELARAILTEAVEVARADGAKLGPEDVERLLTNFAGWHATGGSSMLYDRLAGRPLEHDHITGALVERADRHGIPVPVNRTLLALLSVASGHPLDGSG